MTKSEIFECFSSAKKEEKKGKKHKGLLFVGHDDKKAEEYIQKLLNSKYGDKILYDGKKIKQVLEVVER